MVCSQVEFRAAYNIHFILLCTKMDTNYIYLIGEQMLMLKDMSPLLLTRPTLVFWAVFKNTSPPKLKQKMSHPLILAFFIAFFFGISEP